MTLKLAAQFVAGFAGMIVTFFALLALVVICDHGIDRLLVALK